jgi:hypothetical protein
MKITGGTAEDRIKTMLPILNERQRRIFLATEAKAPGYGGISKVSEISGVSRVTITQGVKEIETKSIVSGDTMRCRKEGGGRKSITHSQSGIMAALESLTDGYTSGDPMASLMWTSKSIRNPAGALAGKGHEASYVTIAELLRKSGYGLQSNRKGLAIQKNHPERNEQFGYINKQVKRFSRKKCPVLSIDAKKKENTGNFKNGGKEYRKKGEAVKVLDHDFSFEEPGTATPYGIYDIFRNAGFVSVGVSGDTAEFAVESIRKWRKKIGRRAYPEAKQILITADSGGSNGYRVRLWKAELQILANQINKKITVLHFPPGTSNMEQNRTPAIFIYQQELEGETACKFGGYCKLDRFNQD